MKNFINRPIPRLLRYELLLKQILSETPGSHNDRKEVPPVIELVKSLERNRAWCGEREAEGGTVEV